MADSSLTRSLLRNAATLRDEVDQLTFDDPVHTVYNPLAYAWAAHSDYLRRFARSSCEVLLLGMNPGPWGMAQTGVPFGEVTLVRDWIGVKGKIRKPEDEHPKRPVDGWDCPRNEVSGARLWGWAKERFETPDRFFERFFVYNYCPLSFMEASGRNLTPDKLAAESRKPLEAICDQALSTVVEALEPAYLVGLGAFAEKCFKRAVPDSTSTRGRILHPSPASPVANRGWAPQAEAQLQQLGIKL